MIKILCALMIVVITADIAFCTTYSSMKFKCSVCGTEKEYRVLTSTNAFGPSDLDTRPPEMQRSTMPMWVQECPECGYAASEISDSCDVSPDFLKSEAYITCEGHKLKSPLASRFYKVSMIQKECGNIRGAFFAVLHGAWACDDAKDMAGALACREKAASFADELIADESLNASQRENIMLMRADILRRAGRFEDVIRLYSGVKFSGKKNNLEVMNAVLKFELELARKEDSRCYTIKDALRE